MLTPAAKSLPAIPIQNPVTNTFSSLLSRCKTLPLIKQIHAQILRNGLHRSVVFSSKLSDSYIKVGYLQNARQVFEDIPHKNSHSWNTIISGYSMNRLSSDVLRLFKRMRSENYPPDSFNLAFAVKACIGSSVPGVGKSVHADAFKVGLGVDPFVAPALINMYIELGCLVDARNLFDEVPVRNSTAWGAMMNGYLKFSKEVEVLELFVQMQQLGLELDPFTVVGLVRVCGNVCAGREGSVFHGYCVKRKILDSNVFLKTSIVDMYGKCGLLDSAQKLFEEMSERDVVLWSAMVSGLAHNGRSCEALYFFWQMVEEEIVPNMITFASVLLACSQLGALREGKSIHGYVVRNGVELDVVTYTAFVDMYSKCGCVMHAENIFNVMPKRNVYSWSAMINGFGNHGLFSEALKLFDRMISENYLPNSVTFISVLSACSHSGRVEEGWRYFDSMTRDYGITPLQEHYACMVDLLGRVGQIDEALSFIKKMPEEPSMSVWGALLGACGIHKNVELAEIVAKKLFVLEPNQPDVYVLLSNIYAATGMWDRVKKMRGMMDKKGLHKTIGYSLIEVEKRVHRFSAKDRLVYTEDYDVFYASK